MGCRKSKINLLLLLWGVEKSKGGSTMTVKKECFKMKVPPLFGWMSPSRETESTGSLSDLDPSRQ